MASPYAYCPKAARPGCLLGTCEEILLHVDVVSTCAHDANNFHYGCVQQVNWKIEPPKTLGDPRQLVPEASAVNCKRPADTAQQNATENWCVDWSNQTLFGQSPSPIRGIRGEMTALRVVKELRADYM
jgi:hypothetical protein